MTLSTPRCVLRPWRMSDAAALVRHADNAHIARQLRDRFPHPYTLANARTFIALATTPSLATNLAIEVEGEAAGGIGWVPGSDVERFGAEIGYWLGESLWGRGIVTDALRLATGHAFREQGLLRLYALPFADNAGSIRVLEKAGYQLEGRLRSSAVKFGVPRDQLLYARVNPDWPPHRPAVPGAGLG